MDLIKIEDYRISASIGIYEREQNVRQTISLDVVIGLSVLNKQRIAINETIDYAIVIERIQALVDQQHYNLIETLGEDICNLLLNDFSASMAKVSISKLGMFRNVAKVSVVIERNQSKNS